MTVGTASSSYRLTKRLKARLTLAGVVVLQLALLAFMPSLWTTALLVFAFFFAYYVYEPPYRGLYPDLLPETVYGRSQSVQHLFRGLAIAGALVGGPIAGVAAYLAQKALKDPFGQLASFEYDVTGKWSEPTVKRVPRPAPAPAPATGGE